MSSLFGRFKGNSAQTSSQNGSPFNKKTPTVTPSTPLEQLLVDAGPLRGDGSDKFFGMHNPSNTCYCNSVLQCLYYSEPFRHRIVEFPRKTPADAHLAARRGPVSNGTTPATAQANTPSVENTNASSTKKPALTPTPAAVNKAEENKNSFDYQKKQAMANGPNIRMDYGNFESYGMPESLFTVLKDIFEAVITHESRTGVVTPEKFLEVLRRNYELFRTPMHQDAHEFLNILLNEVVEQVEAYSKQRHDAGLGIAFSPPAPGAGANIPLATPRTNNSSSWVHELFEGTLTSETRCLTCENISRRDEAFLDLSVDLDEHSSVTSCLTKFSEEEMLCERNKFHCDKCGGLQEAEKRMKIKRLPHILAIHLKRFKYIEDLSRMQKLFHRVVFPFHLRLPNTTVDCEDPDRLYELYGIVVHLGSTPFHGHYVSIIKTEKGWILFDDELVMPVDRNYVRNFFGGDSRNPACAYVLFYQETTEEAILREQDAEDAPTDLPKVNDIADTPALKLDTNGIITSGSISPTSHSPDQERANPLLQLDHAITAPSPTVPPPPFSPGNDLAHTATEHLVSNSTVADGPDSADGKPPGGAAHVVKSGSLKFRHSSLSFRSRPKFWSSKDKSESHNEAIDDGVDGTGSGMQEQANAHSQEPTTDKLDRTKSSRFSLGRKKPT